MFLKGGTIIFQNLRGSNSKYKFRGVHFLQWETFLTNIGVGRASVGPLQRGLYLFIDEILGG